MLPVEGNRLSVLNCQTGKTIEQEILEYCQEPRTRRELCEFVKMTDRPYVMRTFVQPMIKSGKLKATNPNSPTVRKQKFIDATVDIPTASDAEVIELCMCPRTKAEVMRHFDLSQYHADMQIGRLIQDGKLIKNDADKLLSKESDIPPTRKDEILHFCYVPKTREEVAEYFGVKNQTAIGYINPLVTSGELRMTIPGKPKSIHQKFVRANSEVPVFVESDVAEFCCTLRAKNEIRERYGLTPKQVTSYISQLVSKGIIHPTNLIAPQSAEQTYIASGVKVNMLTEKAILDFCITQRSSKEISNHFGLTTKKVSSYLRPLLQSGKIQFTIPNHVKDRAQKYLTV